MTTQFDRVYMVSQQSQEVRHSLMLFFADSNLFISTRTPCGLQQHVIAMSSSDIKWARWLHIARGFQLHLGLKDRRREVFDGFERDVSPYS